MITLKTEEYCNNCPDFEACVEKEDLGFDTMTLSMRLHHTYIRCVHADRCGNIKHFIEKQFERGVKCQN